MTPSFRGRIAVIEPGVLPSISLATRPTALPFWSTRLVPFFTATTLGSFRTIPSPLTHTRVLHVPRSMPMSMLNIPRRESKITRTLLVAPGRRTWALGAGAWFTSAVAAAGYKGSHPARKARFPQSPDVGSRGRTADAQPCAGCGHTTPDAGCSRRPWRLAVFLARSHPGRPVLARKGRRRADPASSSDKAYRGGGG